MKLAQDIILKPIITEKAMDGISSKKYTFKVAPDATKPEIASAVEELFGVKVAKRKYHQYEEKTQETPLQERLHLRVDESDRHAEGRLQDDRVL